MKRGAAMTTIELTQGDEAQVEEFAGRLFDACLATMELANVELGIRLGLYESLAGAGPVAAAELAERAGIAPRDARRVARTASRRRCRRRRRRREGAGRASVRAAERGRARAARRRQRSLHEAVRRSRAVAGQGDRHHGRGVPSGHGRGVRLVRPARRPSRVHSPGVREPPDAELVARVARGAGTSWTRERRFGSPRSAAAKVLPRSRSHARVHERGGGRLRPRRRVDRRGPARRPSAAGVADRARFERARRRPTRRSPATTTS